VTSSKVDSLTALRRALDLSQVEFGQLLGVGQNAVSQMEKRRDMRLSTLDKVVSAASMQLEIALLAPDGTRIPLPHFHPWRSGQPAAKAASSPASAKKTPSRPRRVTHSTRAAAQTERKTEK
jgi:transcriptional regulator with XRE-family HTH domain